MKDEKDEKEEVKRHIFSTFMMSAQVDDFWTVELKGENLVLEKGDATVVVSGDEVGEAVEAFKRRKKLKAVVLEVKEGIATLQILRWADLHRHSGFSLLDGASHIKDLVRKTEYAGAISDHGVMFGALEYYKKMKEAGKRPIIGMEAYCETIDGKKEGNHLLLLAKDLTGFQNLMKLTSKSQHNFHRKPHVSYAMLREHAEGLIATSSCMGSEVDQLILKKDFEGAKRVIEEMMRIFGKDDYYIEIQRHGFEDELHVNPYLIKFAKEYDLKIVATIDSHYTEKEDAHDHEILLCMGTQTTMDDPKRMQFPGEGYHIHTADEIEELFADMPEVLDNTLEIAEKCNLKLEFGKNHLPSFDVPEGFTESTYFEHLIRNGFEKRFMGTPMFESQEYRERLDYEIKTIQKMGFEGYFLIVWDFIKYAKDNNIPVGPGRGSVVGSLVAYCLEITDLDPIPYGLLFERFLNPDRVTMPDIDVDFADDRRDEVIQYVKQKYTHRAVSKIITFGTLAARMAVRDVGRALGYPYSLGDRIAKTIPATPKMTLKKAKVESPEFKKLYETEADVKRIVDTAMKIEGLPRHTSIHACGIIIAPTDVDNYVPQILVEDKTTKIKELVTQFPMSECEEVGLLKMDFLGLRNMTVIDNTLVMVNKDREKQGLPPLRYLDIPLNDKKVYQDIAKGESYGVFQLESGGMRSFMKELFADADQTEEGTMELFERLIAGISLYRPGPLDEIPNYIKNVRNPEYIQYDHSKLKDVLKNTYGIIVYQEQVMQIVRELAGYSLSRSDLMRRAIGKKKKEIVDQERANFIDGKDKEDGTIEVLGSVRNGVPREVAEKVWDLMYKFVEYAFNKSHAAAYAMIGAITAWLKYYFPVEYMTAILNSYISNADKLKIYLSVVKAMKIEILPPDVNSSMQLFSVDNGRIRFGLQGIKGLGKASENIISERQRSGEFKSIQDFVERMAINAKIDKKILEAMIFSGAVDSYEGSRLAKLHVLEEMLKYASSVKKEVKHADQLDLFGWAEEEQIDLGTTLDDIKKKVPTPNLPEMNKKEKLEKEKEYAGFYVTEHPLDDYVDYFKREGVYEIGFLKQEDEEDQHGNDEVEGLGASVSYDGESVKIAGIIKELKIFYTKRDQKPLYVFNIEDKTGEMKSVCFHKQIEQNQDKLVEGKVVIIHGTIKEDEFETQIIVNSMFDIESIAKSEKPKALWVKTNDRQKADELVALLSENKGDLPMFCVYGGKKYELPNVNLNFALFTKLQDMFGNNVKVTYH